VRIPYRISILSLGQLITQSFDHKVNSSSCDALTVSQVDCNPLRIGPNIHGLSTGQLLTLKVRATVCRPLTAVVALWNLYYWRSSTVCTPLLTTRKSPQWLVCTCWLCCVD